MGYRMRYRNSTTDQIGLDTKPAAEVSFIHRATTTDPGGRAKGGRRMRKPTAAQVCRALVEEQDIAALRETAAAIRKLISACDKAVAEPGKGQDE